MAKQTDPGTVEAVTAGPKPLNTVLAMLEGGGLQHDAADELRALVSAMSEHSAQHGKSKGTFTLVLDLKMEGGVVDIVGDIKVKAPKLKREKSVFWVDPANNLTQQNPKQLVMGLRVEAAPVREAAKEAAPAPAAQKV